jgi:hypothetical protein
MNRITAIALLSTATFNTVGSAVAHAQKTLEAKIPFAFVVRSQVLPAGAYRISSIGTNLVQIATRDKRVMETSTALFDNNGPGSGGRLVFTKYGNQYFLREVLCDSPAINSALPLSNLEKLARIRVARLRSAEQTVASVR